MKLVLRASVFLLLTLRSALGAEITVHHPAEGPMRVTFVYVDGKIQMWDSFVFKRLTEALKGDVSVILSSPGGACEAAISIGSFIRMNQWETRVASRSKCSSACALIWFGGINRALSLDSLVGLHSTAMPDGSGKRNDKGNKMVADYLRSIDVPEGIIRRWYRTEPWDMDYINFAEAYQLGLLGNPPPKDKSQQHRKDRPPFWHELGN